MENENTRRSPRNRHTPPRKRRTPDPEIQYTQPKPFFRNRLIVQLLSIAAVVLAFTIGVSIFFKVDTVMVTGAVKHSPQVIAEASGVKAGDSLLFFGRARAAAKIKTALPYVDTVRYQVKLPGTVNIIVEEKMVASAVQAIDGSWWMITADGVVAEKISAATAADKPLIEGVYLQNPKVGEPSVAAETAADGAMVTTAADHLKAAITVLSALEENQLFSHITRLDVTDLFALRIYCSDDYRVELGESRDMTEKVEILKYALAELGARGGVLKLVYNDTELRWEIVYQTWSQQ